MSGNMVFRKSFSPHLIGTLSGASDGRAFELGRYEGQTAVTGPVEFDRRGRPKNTRKEVYLLANPQECDASYTEWNATQVA
ncbi:hypothetical protein ACFLQN_01510 [Candidatus Aenigmatarchaeota archaeon]